MWQRADGSINMFRTDKKPLSMEQRHSRTPILKMVLAGIVAAPILTGCVQERVYNNGPVITQDQLDLIPVGSNQDQVLLALGSPSSRAQFGNDVFYYISQKRTRTYEFEKLKLIDQRVLSVYFDEEQTVSRIANYGLQDGKVFDFITRTTPTGGEDFTFLRQILTGRASPSSAIARGTDDNAPPGF